MPAVLAASVCATLAAATVALALGIEGKMGKAFSGLGHNIVVMDKAEGGPGGDIEAQYISRLAESPIADELESWTPLLYGIAEVQGRQVLVAGTDFEAMTATNSWWKVEGDWALPEGEHQALLGANLSRQLGLEPGGSLALTHEGHTETALVSGVVTTGSDEENTAFLPLATAQKLLGREGKVSLIEVRTRPGDVGARAAAIEDLLPSVKAVTVRQVAEGERYVLRRVVLLLALVTLGVVACSAVGLTMTAMAAVVERRGEIGLMKALGADDGQIHRLFLAESAASGLAGGLLGATVGAGLAQVVGLTVFSATVPWRWEAMVLSMLLATALVLLAALPPLHQTVTADPVRELRND